MSAMLQALEKRPAPASNVAVQARGIVKEFGEGETRIRVLHGIDADI